MRRALFLGALILCGVVHAGTEAGLRLGYESLDRSLDPWRMTRAEVAWREGRDAAWFAWHEVERFAVDDDEISFGLHHGLGTDGGVALEASIGGDAGLLPERAWRLALDHRLGAGFGLHAGWREARYANSDVRVLDAGLERYAGDWRAAWTVYRGSVAGLAARGTAHLISLERYYGDGSRVGLSLATGSEVERVGPAAALVTDLTDLGLGGRHWFGPRWGATWRIGWHEQGTLYTRKGLELGLVARF